MTKQRASDEIVQAFMAAIYPDAPHLATAAFDEVRVLLEATRQLTEGRAENARLRAAIREAEELLNDTEMPVNDEGESVVDADNYERVDKAWRVLRAARAEED